MIDKALKELQSRIRPYTDKDKELLHLSYSALDTFCNCPYRYKLNYEDKCSANSKTLPLELGTLCHLILELKGRYLNEFNSSEYPYLLTVLNDGRTDKVGEKTEYTLGVNQLKVKYWEDWYVKDNKSGLSYDNKIAIFKENVLTTRMEDRDWTIVGTEVPFKFVYDEKVVFRGFIDRVDRSNINYKLRITDYKTSKAIYPDSKIKTPLQHIIYDMACLILYGELPAYHEYDFILIDKTQNEQDGVCSPNYISRGIKKIDKIIDQILESDDRNPKPTPLCFWCPYSGTTHEKNQYNELCEYYLLWTPQNKNFGTNKRYVDSEQNKNKQNKNSSNIISITTKRKIVF